MQQPPANAGIYRPRRPAGTLLHRVMRENLETYLAGSDQACELGPNVPFHVAATYRQYLKCGILAHGFARVYCANCGHDFLVAFSCKGRDICPACATGRQIWRRGLRAPVRQLPQQPRPLSCDCDGRCFQCWG